MMNILNARRAVLGALSALALVGCAGVAVAQSDNPSFSLVNLSGETIYAAYASSADDDYWRQDRLGSNVLPPGNDFPIHLPRGQCINDVRVVFVSGREITRMGVDTCRLRALVVTPSRQILERV